MTDHTANIPRICDSIVVTAEADSHRYRVIGFYKTKPVDALPSPDTLVGQMLLEMALDARAKDEARNEVALIPCAREEAEFVSAYSVGGIVKRVQDVTVVGRVDWSDAHIADEEESHAAEIKEGFPVRVYRYWDPR